MTTREFYVAIAEAQVSDELTTKAQELIAALDARNEKRKSTTTKDKLEAQARREAVLNFFKSNPNEVADRDSIAAQLGITPAQVTAACKPWVEAGVVTKSEGKVGKSRKVLYSLAA